MYGKMRALISKKRTSSMQVKTSAATAGVRGTDFLARHSATSGTEVAVLSGKVEVKPEAASAPPVTLKAQQSVAQNEAGAQFTVTPLTKAQVLSAHEATSVPAASYSEADAEVKNLESKAKTTVIEELQISQPKVFAQLKNTENLSIDQLNRKLIEAPLKRAKATPITGSAVESMDKDLENYKKYMDEEK
jgi:hypothetical protein